MKVKAMALMLALAGMAHASVNTSIHVTPESNSQTRVVDQGLSHL
ncbi:hypothetical protein [Pectobacterium aquaticum]|nr:hypothetical protein [Pectobacterium aquaticum]MBN3171188.1 TIGR03759 family integrating conjugative element protein [Pectobacterium brasiliense]